MMAKLQLLKLTFFIIVITSCTVNLRNESLVNAPPDIFPDYSDIIIPVNIAPLNFRINHPGIKYCAVFSSGEKAAFKIVSKKPEIIIPIRKWRKLLADNSTNSYTVDIYVKTSRGNWTRYHTIENRISVDPVDPYIAFRRINAGMIFWENMAIVQRDLENFQESDIVSNKNSEKNCMNCHTFCNRNPETFILHLRRAPGGTLIKTKEKNLWLNTKTPYTLSAFVYPAWHPNGRFIAFSTNKIHQNFYGTGHRNNHVRDEASDLAIYDIDSNLVFTDPKVSTLNFENLPAWSPDGRYLYYINCAYEYKFLHDSLEMYDLMRISFNPETREFGDTLTILSSKKTGLSISFPQISPDGKYMAFCMADFGYFHVNNTSSDIYLMNLSDLTYAKAYFNSDLTESFPNWSGNSRWLMFSTKRIDCMYTLPHFAYIDSTGRSYKPFPLPLKHPQEYYTRLTNMNRPVFISGKVVLSKNELQKTIYGPVGEVIFDSTGIDIDALTRATPVNETSRGTSVPYMRD